MGMGISLSGGEAKGIVNGDIGGDRLSVCSTPGAISYIWLQFGPQCPGTNAEHS